MLRLTCSIRIESEASRKAWVFDKMNACRIEMDNVMLTDRCSITLPKKTQWGAGTDIPVKRGDRISVSLGYDGENVKRFEGYVTRVNTKAPVVLDCEDMMWKLKQTGIEGKSWPEVMLSQVLAYAVPKDIPFHCPEDMALGKYLIRHNTVAGVLNDLKSYGVKIYTKIVNGTSTLFAVREENGKNFTQEKRWVFRQGLNIIANHTQRQYADQVKVLVRAISTDKDGEQITVSRGDREGEERMLSFRDLTLPELTACAEEELRRLKYDTLFGSITTFGVPEVDKGDVIGLACDDIGKSNYSVKRVTVTFGTGGYRQTLELDKRV